MRKTKGYYTLVGEVFDFVWEAPRLHAILTSSTTDQAHVFDICLPAMIFIGACRRAVVLSVHHTVATPLRWIRHSKLCDRDRGMRPRKSVRTLGPWWKETNR